MSEDFLKQTIAEEKAQWNQFVIDNSGSFLQSWDWGRLHEKLGRRVWRFARKKLKALLISYYLPFGKKYLYAPRGPVIKLDSQSEIILNEFLSEVSKNHGAETVFLRIEPTFPEQESAIKILKQLGFRESVSAQPKDTRILDLSKSEAELLAEMEHDTRYAVRIAEKRGVRIIKGEEFGKAKAFEEFWRLFEETNRRHRLKIYPKSYYWEVVSLSDGCESRIYLAELEQKIVSVSVIIIFGTTAVYLYSASAAGYGRFNAPTLLLWEAIKDAKKSGSRIFDFWGVSRENKKWRGITAFKKSFGGREVNFVGTWDYVFDPRWYFLYRLSKTLTR